MLRLILGLGNPGPKYAETRHNAGFWFVERLAASTGIELRSERRFAARLGRGSIDGHDVRLACPETFVNRSGQALRALTDYFDIPCEAVLVVHDELDLPPGVAKLKQGGGHGGHNGLRSIFEHVQDRDFWRLRIGIGHPGHRDAVTPWVLNRPSAADREAIEESISEALEVIPEMLAGDFPRAMNRLHRTEQASTDDTGSERER